ncbi:MAG: tetratricopeptide repeat protein [Planctomycetota bacterium]
MARRFPQLTRFTLVAIGLAGAIACDSSDQDPDTTTAAPSTIVPEAERTRSLEAVQVYLDQGDLASAEAILSRFVEKVADDARAFELYGVLRLTDAAMARANGQEQVARERFTEAYTWYERALAIRPDDGRLHQSAGEVADAAGDLENALAHYERAMELDPENAKPPFFAAQVHLRTGDPDRAIELLETVLELDPSQAYAHASMAVAAYQRGDNAAALESIRTAREIDPADVGLRVQMARLLRQTGSPRDGLELLLGLPLAEQAQLFVLEEIEIGYLAINRPADAAKVWQAIHAVDPSGRRAWFAAVRAATLHGRDGNEAAAKLWLGIAEQQGRRPEIDAARSQIESLFSGRNNDG